MRLKQGVRLPVAVEGTATPEFASESDDAAGMLVDADLAHGKQVGDSRGWLSAS